jgi:succinyl-diaminopimelate desuccinylase
MTGAKARLLAELSRRRKELIELCAALVRIPSENPPGDTSRIAAFVVRYLRERGMRSAIHEPRKGMPNVVAGLGRGAPNLERRCGATRA